MSFFGRPTAQALTPLAQARDAMEKLEAAENLNRARMALLDKKIGACVLTARTLVTQTRRNDAKVELKRMHAFEREHTYLYHILLTVESARLALERAILSKETYDALHHASRALHALTGKKMVDDADDMMDQLKRFTDMAQTTATVLATPLEDGQDDDDILERELDKLIEEQKAAAAAAATDNRPSASSPAVPAAVPVLTVTTAPGIDLPAVPDTAVAAAVAGAKRQVALTAGQ